MLDTSKLDILCICKVSIENVPIYGGYTVLLAQLQSPCQVGLVVCMSASHTVGRGFASQSGNTEDHHTNCLPALHACIRPKKINH